MDKATGEKLQKMKESDPAAYEAELKKIGEKAVAGDLSNISGVAF